MSTFNLNCTLPPAHTTFVRSPNARGTLDILWSCLAVVVLCTWSVQHLNIPPQIRPANWKQKCVRAIDHTWTKFKWMVFNMLAPEAPFAQAVNGIICGQRLKEPFDRWKKEDNVEWTLAHTELANMGGFVIAFGSRTERPVQYADSAIKVNTVESCVVEENRCKCNSSS